MVAFSITGLRAHGLPGRHITSHQVIDRHRNLYVTIAVGGSVRETGAVNADGTAVQWNETFFFDAEPSSQMTIKLYMKHHVRRDKCIGTCTEAAGQLFDQSCDSQYIRAFHRQFSTHGNEEHGLPTHINFTVKRKDEFEYVEDVVEQATESLLSVSRSKILDDSTSKAELAVSAYESIVDLSDSWGPVIEKLELLSSILDTVAEIHPYAQIACNVINAAYKVVHDQIERDEKIQHLLSAIRDALSFVTEAHNLLEMAQSQKEIVAKIVQQTADCGYFLQIYARDKQFVLRAIKNAFSNVDEAINKYESVLLELKNALQGHATLQTNIVVVQILNNIDVLSDKIDLTDMQYAYGAGYQSGKTCLAGTREEILDSISAWINDASPDCPRVYLLTGVAGTGKSAIAHTVAARYHDLGRLGSSFCFSRSESGRTPDKVFSTIARDLASQSPQIRRFLANLGTSARNTRDIHDQFENFLVKATADLAMIGPTVIVIDAADESGIAAARRPILQVLAKRTSALPPNFRILVTSRPYEDVLQLFDKNTNVMRKSMDSLPSTNQDIEAYIIEQLSDDDGHLLEGLEGPMCKALAVRSEGLFQWAFVSCQQIKGNGRGGLSPSERYSRLMSSTARGLDALYLRILSDLFDEEDTEVVVRFRAVMGQVLVAFEPLSIASLQRMQTKRMAQKAPSILAILRFMGSLLSGVSSYSEDPVRPLHTSFRDFLTDPERSGAFHVDISEYHADLCLASIDVMNECLCFNICNLETSYLRNNDVPDFDSLVENAISPALSYACRLWGKHLQQINFDELIYRSIQKLMSNRLLYWFEVLSVLKKVSMAQEQLSVLIDWVKAYDENLAHFAKDSRKFISYFAVAISESAPHVYLSALPFSPEGSLVANHYRPLFPHTLSVDVGEREHWPLLQHVLPPCGYSVNSVATFPDGKRIVSGGDDFTIRIWDMDTGFLLLGPLEGHEGYIRSVAVSSDGKLIASASSDTTIRIWDADTGTMVSDPLTGHEHWVKSVCFSPDSRHIVSGSLDNTVRIWDVETGVTILGPLEGHTNWIRTVAYSPDGKLVASGSDDMTIRVWDTKSGTLASPPLVGHQDKVVAVAFMHDGENVVSAAWDSTVRIWNMKEGSQTSEISTEDCGFSLTVAFTPDMKHFASASSNSHIHIRDIESGSVVSGPFEGHENPIFSMAFSPDGKSIVSASSGTLKVWDVERKSIQEKSHNMIGSLVTSIAYSPDGTRIAAAMDDRTVRVWDVETGSLAVPPLEGHGGGVFTLAYSSDGKYLASGSWDRTALVWDLDAAKVAVGPLTGHDGWVMSVAFSPDGKTLATAADDRTIYTWDLTTGEAAWGTMEAHDDGVNSLTFSPDGRYIISGGGDGSIRVWYAETGEEAFGPLLGHEGPISSVAISFDGKRIASGSSDATVRVWDVSEGKAEITRVLAGHRKGVTTVAFSPDAKSVASGSRDGTAIVWDVELGLIALGPFIGHTWDVESVAFSPDGRRLATGSIDRTIRFWNVEGRLNVRRNLRANFLEGAYEPVYIHILPDLAGHGCEDTKEVCEDASSKSEEEIAFTDQSYMNDGWILGPNDELLFWLPPVQRQALMRPSTTRIIGRDVTSLDLTRFVHGERWVNCRDSS